MRQPLHMVDGGRSSYRRQSHQWSRNFLHCKFRAYLYLRVKPTQRLRMFGQIPFWYEKKLVLLFGDKKIQSYLMTMG
jgi:hypothetical protein